MKDYDLFMIGYINCLTALPSLMPIRLMLHMQASLASQLMLRLVKIRAQGLSKKKHRKSSLRAFCSKS